MFRGNYQLLKKKINELGTLKKFINYYFFSIISSIIGFYSISYLTKHLTPEHYGMIGIFLGILFFIPSLLSFSANGLQAINIVEMKETDYIHYRNKFITFILIWDAIIFCIAFGIGLFIKYEFILVTVVTVGLLKLLSSLHSTELIQFSKPTAFGLLDLLTISLTFLITVILISLFDLDWKGRIWAIIIAEAVMFLVRFWGISSIGPKFTFVLDLKEYKYFIYFGLPVMASLLAAWIINQSDRFLILHYFSLTEVGLYTAAYGVSSIISTMNQTIIKVLAPPIYLNLSANRGRLLIKKYNKYYAIIILLIAAIVSLISYLFLDVFFDSKYHRAIPIVCILSFAQAFFGIYSTSGVVLDYYRLNKLKMILIWMSAVGCLISAILLVPLIGFYAPAIGTLVSFVILAFVTRHYVHMELNKRCVV